MKDRGKLDKEYLTNTLIAYWHKGSQKLSLYLSRQAPKKLL
jgi:hypothetical protein